VATQHTVPTVPISRQVLATTDFWNPLQNFLLVKFKLQPESRLAQWLVAGPLLREHSNVYTFVISYLKPIRRFDIQKINTFFNNLLFKGPNV
jgi:hypothetical protein